MNYRAEIDGLRALAMIPIILFHAEFEILSGGYVGVDVFFVISGYLITNLIMQELHHGTFKLSYFYERRARRILPALFFVLIVCIPLAWLFMLPDPMENFGQSIVATVLFSNNILLYITTGYWDLAAEFKPLLHTWSLGVEEQYYLIIPVLLALLFKLSKKSLSIIIAILMASSFIAALITYKHYPTASFFFLPTRGWELLLGAFIALNYKKIHLLTNLKLHNLLSILGLTFIALAMFLFDEKTSKSSGYMLLPTLGTMLVILYANPLSITYKILANPCMVGIGLVSYSAYLWHQPIFSFFRIYSTEAPNQGIYFILIILTFIIATFSWWFIEKPFRKKGLIPKRIFLILVFLLTSFFLLFGYFAHHTQGFPKRIFDLSHFTAKDINIAYGVRNFQFTADSFEKNDKVKVLVVGRSFARDAINVIRETYDMKRINIIYRGDMNHCSIAKRSSGIKMLEEAEVVLFAPSYSYRQSCIDHIIKLSQNLKFEPFFVGIKHFGYNLNWISRIDKKQRSLLKNKLLEKTKKIEDFSQSFIPADSYISIIKGLGNGNEIFITDKEGNLLSPDRKHLTKHGAIFVGKHIFIPSNITKHLPLPPT